MQANTDYSTVLRANRPETLGMRPNYGRLTDTARRKFLRLAMFHLMIGNPEVRLEIGSQMSFTFIHLICGFRVRRSPLPLS